MLWDVKEWFEIIFDLLLEVIEVFDIVKLSEYLMREVFVIVVCFEELF